MLTLDELKEAVETSPQIGRTWNRARFNALLRYGRKQCGPWDIDFSDGDEWNEGDLPDDDDTDFILNCIAFARDYIAREQLLDTELTSEICEKLGMVKRATDYYVTECRLIRVDIPRGVIEGYIWDIKLTIRHLLAAACLAGVTVDLGRLAK